MGLNIILQYSFTIAIHLSQIVLGLSMALPRFDIGHDLPTKIRAKFLSEPLGLPAYRFRDSLTMPFIPDHKTAIRPASVFPGFRLPGPDPGIARLCPFNHLRASIIG